MALAAIYVMLGLSTNLLVGIVGIFSVSQAAVFGVGAYIVAYFLMATEPMSFLPALAIAAVCCIALNILVTLPSLRVSGDYFVVTSFGIQLLATAVFTNWTAGTGGANGLPGIPPPDLFGNALDSTFQLWRCCACGVVLGCLRLLLADHARARSAACCARSARTNWRWPPPARTCCAQKFPPRHWPGRSPAWRVGCTRRSSASSIRRRSISTPRSCC